MVEQVKISIVLHDDSIVIMSIVTDDFHSIKIEPTIENIENKIKKSGFQFKSWRFINDDDLPKDRTFRNAWKDENNKIDHDIPKAKEVLKDILRVKRSEILKDLDIKYIKAIESNDKTEQDRIAKEKQRLRDITTHDSIVNATTISELKDCINLIK